MIDFTITPQMKMAREMLHSIMDTKVRPLCLQADQDAGYPDSFYKELAPLARGMSGGLGGGSGSGKKKGAGSAMSMKNMALLAVVAGEELGWGDPSMALVMPGAGTGGPALSARGTDEQKEKYFGMLQGSEPRWAAYALTEPGTGSDAAAIRTRCHKDGDEYVINGTKCYISNGARAEWTLVFATIDPSLGHAGQRVFIVEKGTPGFSVGKIEDKLGFRATETAELRLEDCRVPVENLLGGEDSYQGDTKAGFKTAMEFFDTSRPLVGIMAVGIARASYEELVQWAKDNYMLSRPIPRYQAIKDKLADLQRKIDAARLLCWKAAWMADNGIRNTKEASMSKLYGPEVGMEVTSTAVQMMGATGTAKGSLSEKLFRDVKVFDIFEGAHQIQQMVVAKNIFDRVQLSTSGEVLG
ncbi:MAG: acyl-CoA dehydrogenase family protein [Pseudomonadota bacterium]|nr:acyl-CoA dehydrogenase family protein [Pseudomonadota bacterium]